MQGGRILFVVPYVPNLIRVRPYNLIRALAARGHELTVATLWTSEEERADLATLEAAGFRLLAEPLPPWRSLWNSLKALPTGEPLQAHYCWQPALARRIVDELRQQPYDVVHVEHLRGARYGLALKARTLAPGSQTGAGSTKPPIVWDSVDCISHLFEQSSRHGRGFFPQVITRLELPRTRRYEGWLVGQFDRVLTTSPVDAAALAELAHTRFPISILPNGVDLGYFSPQSGDRDPETLVYLGRMSYHANVAAVTWFCGEVLPLIWAERPNVRLLIVGMDPSPAVQALGADPRITVTGTVPDVRPYLACATVSVAPMVYGAGTQFKILESMAMEAAVVTTSKAATAIGVQPDVHLLAADKTSAFAQGVLGLLAQPDLRTRLGQAGRRFVEAHHAWDRIAARLEEIYEQLL